MDFMGDKATLLETGRFVQQPAGPLCSRSPSAVAADGRSRRTGTRPARPQSEARHRLAAEAGDAAAMSVLGALLLRRGDLDGAEPYLRAATADGDRAAANNLGVLLHQRGYADEAAGWWRIAAVAGSAAAAHALGPPPPRARRRARRRVLAAPVRRAGPRPGRVRARRPAGAPQRRRRRALAAGRRRAGAPRGRLPAGACA